MTPGRPGSRPPERHESPKRADSLEADMSRIARVSAERKGAVKWSAARGASSWAPDAYRLASEALEHRPQGIVGGDEASPHRESSHTRDAVGCFSGATSERTASSFCRRPSSVVASSSSRWTWVTTHRAPGGEDVLESSAIIEDVVEDVGVQHVALVHGTDLCAEEENTADSTPHRTAAKRWHARGPSRKGSPRRAAQRAVGTPAPGGRRRAALRDRRTCRPGTYGVPMAALGPRASRGDRPPLTGSGSA